MQDIDRTGHLPGRSHIDGGIIRPPGTDATSIVVCSVTNAPATCGSSSTISLIDSAKVTGLTKIILIEVGFGFKLDGVLGHAFRDMFLEEVWNLLVGLEESTRENAPKLLITLREEGRREATVTNSSSSACRLVNAEL